MTRSTHHSHDAEQAVIGAVLLAPDLFAQLRQQLAPNDFHHPSHTLLWQAISAMADTNQPIDAIVLSERLNRSGQLSKVGGAPYLHTLISMVPAVPMTSHYVTIIRDHADRRKTLALAERLTQMAIDGADLAAIVTALQSATDDITTRAVTTVESGRAVKLTPASAVKMQPVHWTWVDRIPSGALTLIPGREGIGKSLMLAWLTAQITQGTLPGRHFGQPRPVIYAASEDSWAHTIAPRLYAAGANLDMVYRVEVESDGLVEQLTLPVDCASLAVEIGRLGVALLAADPLLSLISAGIDTHRDRDLRNALEPLVRMADQTGCAVVGLAHFNKSASGDALNLITGSRAFSAVPRAVIAIARDDDADDRSCVMSQAKSNLGTTNLPSLRYVIEDAEVPTDEGPTVTGRLVFLGESERSVSDILGESQGGEPREERDEAVAWLVDYLVSNGGSATKKDVLKAARAEGIAERTLTRARQKARVTSEREGFGAGTIWKLTHSDIESAAGPVRPQSGHSGHVSEAGLNGLNGGLTADHAHTQLSQDDLLTGVSA